MTKEIESTEKTTATESIPTNSKLPILLEKEKLRALRKALGGDRVRFVTDDEESAFDQLSAHLQKVAAATTNAESGNEPFFGVQFFERTGDESAPIENANCIILATVGVRDKATSVNGVKAIVAFESPTVEDFIASTAENVAAFVAKVIERESTDVAFAGLRAMDMTHQDMVQAVAAMPATVNDIVDTSRDSASDEAEAFDELWNPFKIGVLKPRFPKVLAALPVKSEVQKAMRSREYALANPATKALEEAGLFVKMALQLVKLGAMAKDEAGNDSPIDTSSIQGWIDNRNELVLGFSAKVVDKADLTLDF